MTKDEVGELWGWTVDAIKRRDWSRVEDVATALEGHINNWHDPLFGGRREWVPGFGEIVIGPEPVTEEEVAQVRERVLARIHKERLPLPEEEPR